MKDGGFGGLPVSVLIGWPGTEVDRVREAAIQQLHIP
jgi:hypothetical protein